MTEMTSTSIPRPTHADDLIDPRIAPRSQPAAKARSGRWAVAFVGVLIFFQITLFFFGGSSFRLPLRIGGYGTSLAALVLLNGRGTTHPASKWVWVAITILAIEVLNPAGDALLARLGQACLYTAVLAPMLWVGRLRIDRETFRLLIFGLWGFYTASAFVGVLQVKYPGQFDGATTTNFDDAAILRNSFTLSDGQVILRPKGLSDTPGGAGTAGVYTILFGMGVILTSASLTMRGIALGAMGIGLFGIYIGQGRTNLLIVGFAFVLVVAILLRRGAAGKAMILGYIGLGVASIGTSMAFLIGGQSTIDRFQTLVTDNAGTVYQSNRGQFLNELLTSDIYNYPLGAGMGHWGMMCGYFGDVSTSLWAEMLWQALCYDGGIPLIVAYLALFTSMLMMSWKIAVRSRDNEMTDWGAIVFAYTLAALAATFSFPLMSIQQGMELILVNACLYGAIRTETKGQNLPSPLIAKPKKSRFLKDKAVAAQA